MTHKERRDFVNTSPYFIHDSRPATLPEAKPVPWLARVRAWLRDFWGAL